MLRDALMLARRLAEPALSGSAGQNPAAKDVRMQIPTRRTVYMLLAVLGLVVGLGYTVWDAPVTLTCKQIKSDQTVDCAMERRWFWLIPLGGEEIRDVRGASAYVQDYWGEREEDTYWVKLLTTQGSVTIPCRLQSCGDQANRINAFVQSAADETLIVTDLGALSAEGVFVHKVFPAISLGLAPLVRMILWERMFGKAEPR